ncbi:hypothetical protein JHK82_052981 [Glycine max]|uniref:Uncharacterized protein n=2 Tax=Glycine subgen. Soja TaxID=1462606 RepID=K7MXA2_SOYBN|nr:hypothetical protein JHK86_052825 [Glycine max]KAG4915354.1 hypothetical protein JHK87_052911 [Glycine soja]KAG4927197.1 hypothetical protein JHK85_053683 [Glycine max]KAG5082816.1 hypothetical protein JHK84_052854 [Glycine max]KAG5085584.1 hypothetical protein JHK82_052981 [Glycine max]
MASGKENFATWSSNRNTRYSHAHFKDHKDFKKGKFFGTLIAGMYSMQFLKRRLSHAHILLWLDSSH